VRPGQAVGRTVPAGRHLAPGSAGDVVQQEPARVPIEAHDLLGGVREETAVRAELRAAVRSRVVRRDVARFRRTGTNQEDVQLRPDAAALCVGDERDEGLVRRHVVAAASLVRPRQLPTRRQRDRLHRAAAGGNAEHVRLARLIEPAVPRTRGQRTPRVRRDVAVPASLHLLLHLVPARVRPDVGNEVDVTADPARRTDAGRHLRQATGLARRVDRQQVDLRGIVAIAAGHERQRAPVGAERRLPSGRRMLRERPLHRAVGGEEPQVGMALVVAHGIARDRRHHPTAVR
jgi:hypothetical protein